MIRRPPRSTLFPYTTLFRSRNFIGAFRPPGFERRELGQIIEGLAVQHETLTEQAVELELPGEQGARSEEHTSELQSRLHLVCRLLLEKKKKVHTVTASLACSV